MVVRSFGSGAEENAVDRPWVIKGQGGNLFGHCKHDVEILDRQQFGLALLQPLGTVRVLTLGTMPVAAGVVADLRMIAVAALFDVAAQGRGAAGFNGPHDAQLWQRQRVRGAVGFTVLSKDVSQLEGWPAHGELLCRVTLGLGLGRRR